MTVKLNMPLADGEHDLGDGEENETETGSVGVAADSNEINGGISSSNKTKYILHFHQSINYLYLYNRYLD